MAHQNRTSLEGILRIFKTRLEEFVQARGANVTLALPALGTLVLWLRKMLGAKGFESAMKEGLGILRTTGWFMPWIRKGPANVGLNQLIGELVDEVGASLAAWGLEVSDDEVAGMLAENLRNMGWQQVLGVFGLNGAIGGGREAIIDISDPLNLRAHHPLCPLAPDRFVSLQRGKKSQRVPNKHVQVRPFAILDRLRPPVAVCDQCAPLFEEPGHGHGPSVADFLKSIPDDEDGRLFTNFYVELMRTKPIGAARVRWAISAGYLTHAVVREMLQAPDHELEMLEAHLPVTGWRQVFGGVLTRFPFLTRLQGVRPSAGPRPLRSARDRMRDWRLRTLT